MVLERTKTQEFELFPAGHYIFTVKEPVQKKRSEKGSVYYLWRFYAQPRGGSHQKYTEVMFPRSMGPLLRALRQVEVAKDEFEWDREVVEGLQFEADIVHETDKKGTLRAQIKFPKPYPMEEEEVPPEEAPPVSPAPEESIPF